MACSYRAGVCGGEHEIEWRSSARVSACTYSSLHAPSRIGPVPVQMNVGSSEPSPAADESGSSEPSPDADGCGRGEPSPGADVGEASLQASSGMGMPVSASSIAAADTHMNGVLTSIVTVLPPTSVH